MNNDILYAILKKRKRTVNLPHKEYDDYPVIFSLSGKTEHKSYFKVGKDLKLNKVDKVIKEKKSFFSNNYLLAKSLNIGYYLITPLLIGVFFGYWLDRILKTKPFFILIFFIVGTVSSFYNLWKTVEEAK